MADANPTGNLLNPNKYPQIGDDTINLLLPLHQPTDEADIARAAEQVFESAAFARFSKIKIKHPFNGWFLCFQTPVARLVTAAGFDFSGLVRYGPLLQPRSEAMQSEKPKGAFPHSKTCPQCGGDRFRVAKTWQGIESFEQYALNGFRVRKVDADEEIYHEIQCDNCGARSSRCR